MLRFVFIILASLIFLSCKSKRQDKIIETKKSGSIERLKVLPDTVGISEEHFPRKHAPVNISDQRKKAEYEALHFWDMVDFSCIELLRKDKQKLDNSFINFLGLLKTLDNETAKEAVIYPLKKSNGEVLRYLLSSYYRYLYRYNSPFTNHVVYESVLSWGTKTTKLRISEQQQAKNLLAVITRNKVGSKSENFSYTSPDNVTRVLNRSFAKNVLLIFYSPSCSVCKNEAQEIAQNKDLESMVQKNDLEIIFIYPGNNEALWKENLEIFPSFAKVGIASETIVSEGVYDIQAWPTIYLLNSKSEVVLRDCRLKEALQYIMKNK